MSTMKPSNFTAEDIKCKPYLHLDLPYSDRAVGRVYNYISVPENIERHAFYPFVRTLMKVRRWKRDADTGKMVVRNKIREITYASHIDSAIYRYYASMLQDGYEAMLEANGLGEVAVAYRRIPVKVGSETNKCNIDIANEVFDFIGGALKRESKISAIVFDIKGFFDNLDYGLILDSWKRCLGVDRLPKDWYKIYRSVTEYAYVYSHQAYATFKDRIYCRPANGKGGYVTRMVKQVGYLHDRGAVAYCKGSDVRVLRERGLIRTHKNGKHGIPQGLPISAVTANLYMFDFDKNINGYVSERGGLYRRYSDDLIVVCRQADGEAIKRKILGLIRKYKLVIQESKTELIRFSRDVNGDITCVDDRDRYHPIEYLGFAYDGRQKLLKSASIGKYYREMYQRVEAAKRSASRIGNVNHGRIFKGRIIRRYSEIGAKVYRVRVRDQYDHSLFRVTDKMHYGNYISYVNKASNTMKSPAIRRQLRRNGGKLIAALDRANGELQRLQLEG